MQNLMIARPIEAVTTHGATGVPKARHDRPIGTPPALARPLHASTGTVDGIRREVDGGGYGRDETDNRFHELVRRMVADGDERAARAGRRAPRLRCEMEDRLSPCMGNCSHCEGKGGTTTTTKSGGVTRSSWKSCGSCRGTGNS